MCDKAISENGGTLKSAPWAHQKVFSVWNYKLGWFQYPFIFAMINSCRKQSDAFASHLVVLQMLCLYPLTIFIFLTLPIHSLGTKASSKPTYIGW